MTLHAPEFRPSSAARVIIDSGEYSPTLTLIEHSHHLVGGLHVGENPRHCPEFGLVRGPIDLSYGIADDDYPIIVEARHGARATFAARPPGSAGRPQPPQTIAS